MSFFLSLAAFLLALALLVTIHEAGHFFMARRLGVKVLCFSFGFGYPLWHRYDKKGTEFVIRLIPLGGYVKMLDETEAPVPVTLREYAFNRKPLWQRTLIVFAGPLTNFLLAILLFWMLFMKGMPEFIPVVTSVETHSIAAHAGFHEKDEITAINGKKVNTVEDVFITLLTQEPSDHYIQFGVRRVQPQKDEFLTLVLPNILSEERGGRNDIFTRLGLHFAEPNLPTLIAKVMIDSPAQKAGILAGDKILSLNQQPVKTWKELLALIRIHPNDTVSIALERQGKKWVFPVTLDSVSIRDQKNIGQLGVTVDIPPGTNPFVQVMRYNPVVALGKSIEKVGSISWMTLKTMGKMFLGQTNWENLNGPIRIAQGAGTSAQLGFFEYCRFLALISISLGVLNLLPIPLLDGGHLFYYALEAIRGKPLAERGQQIAASIGLAILLLLIAVAFYNDFASILSASS